MKKSMGFVILIMVLLLAACGPNVGETKTQFCTDWKELAAAVQNAKSLNESSTIEQTKDAQKQIADAWDKAVKSAAELKEVQLEATEAAFNAMNQTIDSIPQDATLGQASAAIQIAVTGFEAAVTAINTTVCVAN